MPARKKVTLEQIYAKLVSHDRYFKKIDAHLGKHDRQFEKHDRQFDGITKLLFRIEDSIKAELAKVADRVQQLETNVEKQTGDLERLQQEYFAVAQSRKRIEKNLEDQSRAKRDELSSVLTRLDRIESHLGLAEMAPKA